VKLKLGFVSKVSNCIVRYNNIIVRLLLAQSCNITRTVQLSKWAYAPNFLPELAGLVRSSQFRVGSTGSLTRHVIWILDLNLFPTTSSLSRQQLQRHPSPSSKSRRENKRATTAARSSLSKQWPTKPPPLSWTSKSLRVPNPRPVQPRTRLRASPPVTHR